MGKIRIIVITVSLLGDALVGEPPSDTYFILWYPEGGMVTGPFSDNPNNLPSIGVALTSKESLEKALVELKAKLRKLRIGYTQSESTLTIP